jgi:hypothetical protein
MDLAIGYVAGALSRVDGKTLALGTALGAAAGAGLSVLLGKKHDKTNLDAETNAMRLGLTPEQSAERLFGYPWTSLAGHAQLADAFEGLRSFRHASDQSYRTVGELCDNLVSLWNSVRDPTQSTDPLMQVVSFRYTTDIEKVIGTLEAAVRQARRDYDASHQDRIKQFHSNQQRRGNSASAGSAHTPGSKAGRGRDGFCVDLWVFGTHARTICHYSRAIHAAIRDLLCTSRESLASYHFDALEFERRNLHFMNAPCPFDPSSGAFDNETVGDRDQATSLSDHDSLDESGSWTDQDDTSFSDEERQRDSSYDGDDDDDSSFSSSDEDDS